MGGWSNARSDGPMLGQTVRCPVRRSVVFIETDPWFIWQTSSLTGMSGHVTTSQLFHVKPVVLQQPLGVSMATQPLAGTAEISTNLHQLLA